MQQSFSHYVPVFLEEFSSSDSSQWDHGHKQGTLDHHLVALVNDQQALKIILLCLESPSQWTYIQLHEVTQVKACCQISILIEWCMYYFVTAHFFCIHLWFSYSLIPKLLAELVVGLLCRSQTLLTSQSRSCECLEDIWHWVYVCMFGSGS